MNDMKSTQKTLDRMVDEGLTFSDILAEHYIRLCDMRPGAVFKFHVMLPQTVPNINTVDEYRVVSKLKNGATLIETPGGEQYVIPLYDTTTTRVDFIYRQVPDHSLDPGDGLLEP